MIIVYKPQNRYKFIPRHSIFLGLYFSVIFSFPIDIANFKIVINVESSALAISLSTINLFKMMRLYILKAKSRILNHERGQIHSTPVLTSGPKMVGCQ